MPPSTEISATYRVVTPCFCGGARQRAEFRLPSFKGVLRFWWRALAWSRYSGDLDTIRWQEQRLFGSAETGQSRVVLRLAADPRPPVRSVGTVLSVDDRAPVGEGARYLGYGLMHAFASKQTGVQAGELMRECLAAPFAVTVQLHDRGLDREQLHSLVGALKAVGLFGGIGARSRRGYGSLSLESLQVDREDRWRAPSSLNELSEAIGALRPPGGPSELPDYAVLSSRSRQVLLESRDRDPMQLLHLVGAELVRFRSSGRDGWVLGGRAAAERRFKSDHLLLAGSGEPRAHPRRVAFGLPLNFGPQSHLQVRPEGRLDRRASPMFIHVQWCGDHPVAVVSFLPARFLPGPAPQISVGGTPVTQVDEEMLYQPVHDFLERLLDPDQRQEPFTKAIEVSR